MIKIKLEKGHISPLRNNYFNKLILLAVVTVLITGSLFIATPNVFAATTTTTIVTTAPAPKIIVPTPAIPDPVVPAPLTPVLNPITPAPIVPPVVSPVPVDPAPILPTPPKLPLPSPAPIVVGGGGGGTTLPVPVPPKVNSLKITTVVIPPTSVNVGQTIPFSFSSTNPNNDNLVWSVDWGNGAEGDACPNNPVVGTGKNTDFIPTHSWTTAGTYTVKVTVSNCKGGTDSTSFKIIVNPISGGGLSPITVVAPNGGEQWAQGSTETISWKTDLMILTCQGLKGVPCVGQTYDISYVLGGGTQSIATAVSGTSYNWAIPSNLSTGSYLIKVCQTGTTICDSSDASFSIVAPIIIGSGSPITVISPNGGEQWAEGTTQTISWKDTSPVSMICKVGVIPCGLVQKYDISDSLAGGTQVQSIAIGATGTLYTWVIPSSQTIGSYLIKVCKAGTTVCATSNSFDVVAAGTTGTPVPVYASGGGQLYPPSATSSPSSITTPKTNTANPSTTNTTAPVGQILGAEKFHFTLYLLMGVPYKMAAEINEVMELQKFLNSAGYYPGPIDGNFSATLKAAVVEFQIANGLFGDGIVGPLTRVVLNQ